MATENDESNTRCRWFHIAITSTGYLYMDAASRSESVGHIRQHKSVLTGGKSLLERHGGLWPIVAA